MFCAGIKGGTIFFSLDMKKSGFDTSDIKNIVPMPECNVARVLQGEVYLHFSST